MNGLACLLRYGLRPLVRADRLIHEHSRFKLLFIALFSAALMIGLWAMFLHGFAFLDKLGGVGLMIVHRLFALFFFGLGFLLVLSSMLISYATLFHSREIPFLLLGPAPPGGVLLYKYLHTAWLSSWAFFFIIIPFTGAYAMHEGLPILFSAWTLLFSIPFVLLCAGVGMVIMLGVVRWLPRRRGAWLAAGIAALGLAAGYAARAVHPPGEVEPDNLLLLSNLVPGLKVSMFPLWPSWWVAEGLMALSRFQYGRGLLFWLVLFAHFLVVALAIEGAGRRLFPGAWQKVAAGASVRNRRRMLLGGLDRLLGFAPADVRVMVMKDIRMFLRDPVQWSQFLIFFGILGVYFLNTRNLHYHLMAEFWRNLIAFLNVFSVSAVMASFGSRFVFPQPSLEGQGFWLLGLSPTTMGRVLAAKFLLAAACMLAISVGLMAVSTHLLQVDPPARAASLALATAMSLAVSGLSTGLGFLFMDLRQQNPAAIISGFGGTLNLVLNLVFMFLSIAPFAALFHAHSFRGLPGVYFQCGLLWAGVWLVGLTVLTTGLPLRLAHRSLLRREY